MTEYCNNFMNPRMKCDKENCKYVHDNTICFYYWKYKDCKFGEDCKKRHVISDKKPQRSKKHVKNTECFTPMSKPVDMRIVYDNHPLNFTKELTSRDVVIAPNVFSHKRKGVLYDKLVEEIENCKIPKDQLLKLWHGNDKIEGTHLIVNDHTDWKGLCPTFNEIIDTVKTYFNMTVKATRLNLYKDTSQWKPFHRDAAAVKPEKAAEQNFTVAISFGATRDAAFENIDTKTVISIPQPDGCIYAFCNDTNIIWRHGILQDIPVRDEGRISIILWGWIDSITCIKSTEC